MKITQLLADKLNLTDEKLPSAPVIEPGFLELNTSKTTIKSLAELLEGLNQLIKPGESRQEQFNEVLGLLATRALEKSVGRYVSTMQMNAPKKLTEQEALFLSCYRKSMPEQKIPPVWFRKNLSDLLILCGDISHLPNEEELITCSPQGLIQNQPNLTQIESLRSKIAKNSSNTDSDPKIQREIERDQTSLAETLSKIKASLLTQSDINFSQSPALTNQTSIKATISPETLDILLGFRKSTLQAIGNFLEGSNKVTIKEFPILSFSEENNQIKLKNDSQTYEFEITEPQRVYCLQHLLTSLLEVHRLLIAQVSLWESEFGRSSMLTPKYNDLAIELATHLPNESFNQLTKLNDPEINKNLALLLCERIADRGGKTPTHYALTELAKIQELDLVIYHRLFSDDQTSEKCAQALIISGYGELNDNCQIARLLLQRSEFKELAFKIDGLIAQPLTEKLDKQTAETLILINCLMSSPERVNLLKPYLSNKKKIESLIEKLDKSSSFPQKAKNFCEQVRIKLNRALKETLDDYYGAREIKKAICAELEDHIFKIENPHLWRGKETKEIFSGGWLLHGIPGVGKSFLIRCLANHYNIPLVPISHEDLHERANTKKNFTAADKKEPSFDEYLTEKVTDLKNKMSTVKAPVGIILIDEMEGEFLSRTDVHCTKDDMRNTSILLRKIEELLDDHPEMIFIGITNHIDLVDEAAKRFGRFGFKQEIGYQDKEDTIDIISKTLNYFKVNLSKLELEDLATYFTSEPKDSNIPKEVRAIPEVIKFVLNNTAINLASRSYGNQEFVTQAKAKFDRYFPIFCAQAKTKKSEKELS